MPYCINLSRIRTSTVTAGVNIQEIKESFGILNLYFITMRASFSNRTVTRAKIIMLTNQNLNNNYSAFPFLWRVVYKLSSEVGCGEVTNPK